MHRRSTDGWWRSRPDERGEWLETDSASRARIAVGGIGNVEVEPNTRLQLVANGREHHMALDRGTIHARIWAPPKLFFVATEAATAIDLGCAYTLQVDARGDGMLRVTHGWVGLERGGRATYIPKERCARFGRIGDPARRATRTLRPDTPRR